MCLIWWLGLVWCPLPTDAVAQPRARHSRRNTEDKWRGKRHTLRWSRCADELPNFGDRWEDQLGMLHTVEKQGSGKGSSLAGQAFFHKEVLWGLASGTGFAILRLQREWGRGKKSVWQDSGKYPGHRADDTHHQSWTNGRCGEDKVPIHAPLGSGVRTGLQTEHRTGDWKILGAWDPGWAWALEPQT